jgi:hypothetical protein
MISRIIGLSFKTIRPHERHGTHQSNNRWHSIRQK